MPHSVFISYATEDAQAAKSICDTLESVGVKCWFAPRDIETGVSYPKSIVRAIKEAKLMILVFSSNSLKSDNVTSEVLTAFQNKKERFVFRLENIEPTEEMEYLIGINHWFDAFDGSIDDNIDAFTSRVKQFIEEGSEEADDDSAITSTIKRISPKQKRKFVLQSSILYALAIIQSLAIYLNTENNITSLTDRDSWSLILCILIPILAVIPTIIEQKGKSDRKKFILSGEKTRGEPKPEYFRTYPYDSIPEYMKSFRADKAHEKALQWIIRSKDSILFLSGKSGTGKSSILNAYVCPELEKQNPPVKTIFVRSFDNSVDELKEEFSKLGIEQIESIDDTRLLLEQATRKLSPMKILVVFDQFEELLIIHEHEPERVEQMKELLNSIKNKPIPGLTILLSFRTDYLPLLETLDLPPLSIQKNWFEVNAFTETNAREFLLGSNLELSDKSLNALFEQIAAFEGTRGLVRPIILNMVGLILSKSGELNADFGRKRTENLLADYLRYNIFQREMKDHAPIILDLMITNVGTKVPKTVDEINNESGISRQEIRGTLNLLANAGLVRVIDAKNEIWEVSHDFIAHHLLVIIRGKRQSMKEIITPLIAPASLIIWAFLLILFLPGYVSNIQHTRAMDAVSSARGKILISDYMPSLVSFNFKENKNRPDDKKLQKALASLDGLKNFDSLELSYYPVSDEDVFLIGDLKSISSIFLISSEINDEKLRNIGKLSNLKTLWLQQNNISDAGLSFLQNLNSIVSLDLEMNNISDDGLFNLQNMSGMKHLYLGGNEEITGEGLKYIAGFPSLETIGLSWTKIDDNGLKTIGSMKSLVSLSLSSTRITDSGLDNLGDMQSLRNLILEDVGISDRGLSYLNNLKSLEMLVLAGNKISDEGLRNLKEMTSMKTLSLDNNAITGTGLIHVADLKSLEELYLADNSIEDYHLAYLKDLPLKNLDLQDNRLNGDGFGNLSKMNDLRILNLASNQISDGNLKYLKNLKLEKLNISGNNLTNSSLDNLKEMNSLKYLDISSNIITSDGFEKLQDLSSLEFLYIYGIQISEKTYIALKQKNPTLKILPEKW